MYYSKMKILHHKDKMDSLSNNKITAPVHIRIKPTNVCNHNCYYCSYQNFYGQLGKDMDKRDSIPSEKLREIINDCYEMGVRAITFSGGGEPLMYKDFVSILAYIHGYGIDIGILTNGVFLRGEIAEVAAKYATWVRVSMDGYDNKSYRFYRQCGDSEFDTLMKNIKSFNQNKCVLGVNIIVDKHNAAHLSELVSKVYDLGVRTIKISPAILSNDSKANNDYHSKIIPEVSKQLNYILNAGVSVYNSYHLQLEGFQKDYNWCPYIQILPIIGADLNVYPCHDKAYNKEASLGSIKDRHFKDFWFNNSGKFYNINPSIDCNHHCVTDKTNKMLLEYLNVEHKTFV